MLIAAAVCPHPPLLVPEVAAGAAPELAWLRAACDSAVRRLIEARPQALIVVGAGDATVGYPGSAAGSLARYGVDVRVGGGAALLPLSLTIGRWLLDRAALASPERGGPTVTYQAVAPDTTPARCGVLGARLAARAARTALLAMGDGSAPPGAPGEPAPQARDLDEEVARALAAADADALDRLDVAVAAEARAAGRPAWQVLAGAAHGRAFDAELLAYAAPYGVTYFVASWRSRDVDSRAVGAGRSGLPD